MASQTKVRKSWLPVFLLVLLAFLAIILALSSLRTNTNTATETVSDGQCLNNGQGFNTPQEAFTLAQAAEQYRITQPFGGNYGLGSYTICYQDGTQQRFQSDVYPGFYAQKPPRHITHSEQATYQWLQDELSNLSIDSGSGTAIYAVIFSQVIVCIPCRQDMVSWQKTLREKARINKVYLFIWDIAPGKGFAPTAYPGGTGTPVSLYDLERVPVQFLP